MGEIFIGGGGDTGASNVRPNFTGGQEPSGGGLLPVAGTQYGGQWLLTYIQVYQVSSKVAKIQRFSHTIIITIIYIHI